MENKKIGPVGLGGWLILPALGLFIAPIRIGYLLYKEYIPIFTDGAWQALTTPGLESYHALWGPYLLFEVIGNTVFILFAMFLLSSYFAKSYRFPKLMIVFYSAGFLFVVADYFIGNLIPAVAAAPFDKEVAREMFRGLAGVLIWVPYFLVSKRVKNTFVKQELMEDLSNMETERLDQ